MYYITGVSIWFALSYILTGVYRFTDGVWRVGDILVPLGPQCAPWGSSGELLRTLIRPHPAKMHTKRSKRKKPWMNTVNKTKNKEDIHLESHVPIWCEVRQHLLAILMFPIEIYTCTCAYLTELLDVHTHSQHGVICLYYYLQQTQGKYLKNTLSTEYTINSASVQILIDLYVINFCRPI